jgi:hypothetical protein
MTFTDVRIPAANVIGEVGRGLKYALTILNVGRAISIPAICLGMAKQAWQPTLDRANTRLTFQRPIGERQTQRMRLGHMATNLFAMEALAELVWRMADEKTFDIRIEAALSKLFCSERTIQFLKDSQVIFGGMGYEAAESKRVRGEPAFGIEQLVRDAEMYRIGEGATDVMRPFVAREGLSSHLDRAQKYFEVTGWAKVREWFKLVSFYVPWYLELWRRRPLSDRSEMRHPKVVAKLMYVERTSRRLARAIVSIMFRYQERLRDDQGRQARISAVGEDLLAIAAAALHAESLQRASGHETVWELADHFFSLAQQWVDDSIKGLLRNSDHHHASIGLLACRGQYGFLTKGIIQRGLRDYVNTNRGASSR